MPRHPFIQPSPPVVGVADVLQRSSLEQAVLLVSGLHLDKRPDAKAEDNMARIMGDIQEEVRAIRERAAM